MSTDDAVWIEREEPIRCDWGDCQRVANYAVGDDRRSYDSCWRHRQSLARYVRRMRASEAAAEQQKAAGVERMARQEAERAAAAFEAQERERQALHERIVAAEREGRVYPLVLPPGVPEILRAHVQQKLVERG